LYSVPRAVLGERIGWALEMSNLKGQEQRITGELPGGWKQRLALGCAVLHKPAILFLDEPTSGVDPISRRQFWDLIHQMAGDGVTVFVSTHYMEEAEYCNRLALIYRGKMVALGTPGELKQKSMDGELLSVECEPVAQAMEALQSSPLVTDVAIFGSSLHVVVDEAGKSVAELRSLLEQRSIHVTKIERIRPSLEDVFVALTGGSRSPQKESRP
jgi:ABC-2 type transport system ATP-binding protein